MIRLALDTSTEAFSVAVEKDGIVKQHFEVAARKHGELLLKTIDDILQSMDSSVQEVNEVVYGRGPGAFTGVRIAISAAQGLAMGVGCSLIGVSSLHNLALQAFQRSSASTALVAADARMGEVYFAIFQRDESRLEGCAPNILGVEQVAAPDKLQFESFENKNGIVAIGSGWNVYQEVLISRLGETPTVFIDNRFPDAESNLILAALPEMQSTRHAPEQAVPVYLRNKVAEKSSKPSFLSR